MLTVAYGVEKVDRCHYGGAPFWGRAICVDGARSLGAQCICKVCLGERSGRTRAHTKEKDKRAHGRVGGALGFIR